MGIRKMVKDTNNLLLQTALDRRTKMVWGKRNQRREWGTSSRLMGWRTTAKGMNMCQASGRRTKMVFRRWLACRKGLGMRKQCLASGMHKSCLTESGRRTNRWGLDMCKREWHKQRVLGMWAMGMRTNYPELGMRIR